MSCAKGSVVTQLQLLLLVSQAALQHSCNGNLLALFFLQSWLSLLNLKWNRIVLFYTYFSHLTFTSLLFVIFLLEHGKYIANFSSLWLLM